MDRDESLFAHPIQRGRRSTAALIGFAVVLSTAALAGVAWAAGFDSVRDRLVHPNWTWIVVGLCGQVPALLGYALAVHGIAAVEGGPTLGLRRAWAVVAAGFGPFVLHGGGFAVDLQVLKDAGLDEREARWRTFGLGVLEYAVLAPTACVAAIYLLVHGSAVPDGFTAPWAIAVPAGFAAAFAALRFRGRLQRRRGSGPTALGEALEAVDILRRLALSPGDGVPAFTGMALYWAGEIFTLWATLRAFLGGGPGIAALIIGYATGYALTRRTLPLAGAGAVEALLPFSLLWVHFPLAAAVLAVFAYRFYNAWLLLVPALFGRRALREA
ncbi:MAG: hypothetical protein WBB74_12950 [Gaiellaceae bacterium]